MMSDAIPKSERIIGFVCEQSVDLSSSLGANGALREMPEVRIIKVICSGMVKPSFIEMALAKGAKGVFVTGCLPGDCHYREGNLFIDARIEGTRKPSLKRHLDRDRIELFYRAKYEKNEFLAELRAFKERLERK